MGYALTSYGDLILFDILVVVTMDSMMKNVSLVGWNEVVVVIGMLKQLMQYWFEFLHCMNSVANVWL